MYVQETRGVRIKVKPDYLQKESDPEANRYVWAYTIEIENLGAEPVQLMTREWRITDALGRTEIVRGDGVVGEQPVIKPGGRYSYRSGAPRATRASSSSTTSQNAPRRRWSCRSPASTSTSTRRARGASTKKACSRASRSSARRPPRRG